MPRIQPSGPRLVARTCPECGSQLCVRENRENGSLFLGCSDYPDCDYTERYPTDMRMRAAGAPTLPGMD